MKKLNKFLVAALISVAGASAFAQTTLGTGSYAQSGIAIGKNAISGDLAAGYFSPTQPAYTGGIAIGNGANATGKNIAIGDGISAPQDGIEGNYTFAIGGLNFNTGTIDLRRVVGMADGLHQNDGANLGQVWAARDAAIASANSYTDATASTLNSRITTVQNRANSAFTLAADASDRLDGHDEILAQHGAQLQNHEQRITRLEGMVGGFDGRLAAVEQGLAQTRKQAFQGVAAVAAMNVEVPALAPGEQAVVAGVGSYGGQAALAVGIVKSNYAGQTFSAKVGVSGGRAAVSAGGAWKF